MLIFISNLIKNYFLIKRKLPKFNSKILGGKVITINSARLALFPLTVELFIAYLLACENAEIRVFLDDGVLRHWDTQQYNPTNEWRTPFHKNRISSLKSSILERLTTAAFKHHNIKIIRYSQIPIDFSDSSNKDRYTHHAKSSWIRYFQAEPEDDSFLNCPYYRASLQNCVISDSIGRYILEKYEPDLFITSHGIYSTWGPCYDFLVHHGISCLVWAWNGFAEKSIRLSDKIMIFQSQDSNWRAIQDKKLDDTKKTEIIKYFKLRKLHRAQDSKLYFSSYNSFKKLGFKKNAGLIGLFPNVVWDGNLEKRNMIFDSLSDWLMKTIEIILKTNQRLIIRFHPSEFTNLRGAKKLETILREHIPEIDEIENIILISSSENINTYDLFDYIDLGIVYSGTLALEMTFHNIPVISCGRGVYYGTGFTYEPRTIEEYTKWLFDISWIKTDFQKKSRIIYENLFRFAYWYFKINNYPLPIIVEGYPPKVDFANAVSSSLNPKSNPGLSYTLNAIKSNIS